MNKKDYEDGYALGWAEAVAMYEKDADADVIEQMKKRMREMEDKLRDISERTAYGYSACDTDSIVRLVHELASTALKIKTGKGAG